MKKANIIKIIEALEESSRIIADSDIISDRIRIRNEAYASAYETVINLLTKDSYAKEIAEIYKVEF